MQNFVVYLDFRFIRFFRSGAHSLSAFSGPLPPKVLQVQKAHRVKKKSFFKTDAWQPVRDCDWPNDSRDIRVLLKDHLIYFCSLCTVDWSALVKVKDTFQCLSFLYS
jgi:hypothetical protein